MRAALLSELPDFISSHHRGVFSSSQQHVMMILLKITLPILFGSLMIINFFSAMDKTARLVKPATPAVIKKDGALHIPLHSLSSDAAKQENKQLYAKAKYDLSRRRIFKLSIAIIDVTAFSVFGGAKASNNVLEHWNCAHFEKGKLFYNTHTRGTDILMAISLFVLVVGLILTYQSHKNHKLSTHKAIGFSIGLFILIIAVMVCPSLSSLYFMGTVIAANIFVSLAFTHFANTFLIGSKVEDKCINDPGNDSAQVSDTQTSTVVTV
jgi:hypothetical protein